MDFTYTIVNVDDQAASMEILYERTGYTSYTIGIDKPRKGESLTEVIKRSAPYIEWELEDAVFEDVTAGQSGSLSDEPEPDPNTKFEGVEDDFLNSLPALSSTAVDLIMSMELRNLKLNRVYNRRAELVAVEASGPADRSDTTTGTRMFQSGNKIIPKAAAVGVTTMSRTNNPTIMEYLETDNGFERLEISDNYYLFTQPRTAITGKKSVYSSLEFIELFEDAEVDSVLALASTDSNARKFYDKLMSANFVDKTDPRVIGGMNYLVTAGALSQARADEIMTIG